ncbi:MAG: adenylate/guanylate cyclase domain-containing protein, partial [Anaerolineae bacterium]|nr:adenylate/guanylate cyclase domain-containing protein [Anaerolineae bacterium]
MHAMANSGSLPRLSNPPEKIRFCAACGHKNPAHVEHCLNCTGALGASCPSCQQPVATGSKFCGQCGSPVSASAPTPSMANGLPHPLPAKTPAALAQKIRAASVKNHGERREVTVLFLDVTNFTAAAHQLDSEDVYLLMDETMSLLVEVVHKFEGTIDKFTGDGLMALFGVPIAHENDPERAIRAALEMQQVLQPLQRRIAQTYGFDFQTRIGINTGLAIAGNLGSNSHTEYTVIGDTVNLAARLETAAEPGTVLVSAETFQRTQPLFNFAARPLITVKGIPDPIQTYRPLNVLDKPGRVRGLAGMQIPMIGREQELTALRHILEDFQKNGASQIALITGEAGLGKSRLVSEFWRLITQAEVRAYQGHCLAHTHATPFWCVIELLRDLLNLTGIRSTDLQQKCLEAHLEPLGLANNEILPYLRYVLGLPQTDAQGEQCLQQLDADMLRHQTHMALRQLLTTTAKQTPLVLILEDLHWIDPASKSFLEYLIETSHEIPILLVLVSRRRERKTVLKSLLATIEQEPERWVDIPLQALSEAESRLMVDRLIDQKQFEAQKLNQRIVARAQGNPFYIEEIIRMLIDQEGLVPAPGGKGWQVTHRASELLSQVPGTVKGLILARFDRLPEGVRQTLQVAAVVGPTFSTNLLQEIGEQAPNVLCTHLEQLEAHQFLSTASVRTEPGYRFHHALIQEAIYETLLKRRRRKIHARIAEVIERSSGWSVEEKTEALAFHYFESNLREKALPHLILAAKNAAQRCANETAAEHYRQALTLLPTEPDNQMSGYFEVRLGLAEALKFLGELADASQILSESLEYLWQSNLANESSALWHIVVEALRQMADICQREGNYNDALSYLESGLDVLGKNGRQTQPDLWRSLVDRLAWTRFRQGQLEEAFRLASSAIEHLGPNDVRQPTKLASLFNTLGGVAWQQGRL